MIKNFIFLGTPGVGKGAIANKVATEKGIIHISTGKIFREHIKNKSEIGIKVKAILSSGRYVPDKIVNQIVKEVLQQKNVKKKGFILDGYPRTMNQVKFLNSIIDEKKIKVVLLEAREDIIFKRIAKRFKKENRNDDSKEIINKRIIVYYQKTAPIINYYKNNGLLITVDAEKTIIENVENFYKKCYYND